MYLRMVAGQHPSVVCKPDGGDAPCGEPGAGSGLATGQRQNTRWPRLLRQRTVVVGDAQQ